MAIFTTKKIVAATSVIALASLAFAFKGDIRGLLNPEKSEPFEIESCGVERWDVKVLTDAAANDVNIFPVATTIKDLVNLVTPTPNSNMPRQPVEKQTYTVHCIVEEIKLETDGDYHLLLQDSAGNHMIGEIPDPTCNATTSSLYYGDIVRCRKFIDAHYSVGGSFQTVNRRMVITGVAFVDPPHGQSDAAPNNLELHSILDISYEPANTSGIAEAPEARPITLSVAPNPFYMQAVFRLPINTMPPKNAMLKIFDLAGKEIRSIAWPANEFHLNLDRDNLPKGIYLYKMISGNAVLCSGKLMAE